MKIMISADLEGTCGICEWDETKKNHPDNTYFAQQMTREVNAVCEGSLEIDKAIEIYIKDAHDSARNIHPEKLPECIKILRGWEGVPGGMMAGINKGCDAVAMTGYHSGAYSDGNPLSHTSNRHNQYIKINGRYASEFMINAYAAAYYEVPVIFLSGDKALCDSAKEICPNIETVAVNEGCGGGAISLHPDVAVKEIKAGMKKALQKDLNAYKIDLPEHFQVEIEFKEFVKAAKGSYYPGAVRSGTKSVSFDTDDFYEVLRFLFFVL